ncbi:MAG: glycosyltransferase [Actinobacteria bacterium]|nr:glycosyltransferase [Actinomycetota bacterium]
MSTLPRCAVVIPTFNGAHLVSTCLAAIFAHPPTACDLRVVVVDDASSDRTVERFEDYDERLTVVGRAENGGFAVACNDGAAAAEDADFFVFLNNDTVPLAGWLDALIEEATEHPEAAAVGSKLLYPDGTIQHAGVVIGQDLWPHHLYAGLPGDHPALERGREVTAVTAACMLVHREDFSAMGGFDTAFHNGYEDVDLCLKLRERGRSALYCPRSVLYHLESVTRWADDKTRHIEHNSRLFAERWHHRIEPDDYKHYLEDRMIVVEYGSIYPIRLSISPLLAAVSRDVAGEDPLEHLLSVRTEQVLELQGRRTRAALDAQRELMELPSFKPRRRRTGGSPEILRRGGFQALSGGPGRHRVSVLMPLMDAEEALRATLPILLSQEAEAEMEIVGVDSASRDATITVLEEFDATAIAIDPSEFDHGLTRNLLAEHARGDILVFLNERSRPVDRNWLAPLLRTLDGDPSVAGASSRVLPYPDADLLSRRDGELEVSGGAERLVKRIADWDAYEAMPVEQRRLLLNFHTVSAAVRADVMRRYPFRSVRAIGEDLLWAREVLEAGMALVHEAESKVYHSHDYSLRRRFMRNVDDGIANREINGRSMGEDEAAALVRGLIAGDWRYLEEELALEGEELQGWRTEAALRRAAAIAGQWLGVHYADYPDEVVDAFSLLANSRRGER